MPSRSPAAAATQLVRRLGFTSAVALVVSNMVGTGIFATSGFLAGDLGSPALLIGIWAVGGMLALVGAICYAELAVNFRRSGGEYVYLTEAWGPAWGFVNGWVSFFAGFSAPIAATALALSAYLAYFEPSLGADSGPIWQLGPLALRLGPGQLLACVVVVALTALNLFGVEVAAKSQNVLTALKLAILVLLLGLGVAVGEGSWDHFSQVTERTSALSISEQFALSLVFVYWAYSGWNASVYVAEEIRNPEKNLPRSMITGCIIVLVLYVALNALFVYANPLSTIKGEVAVGTQAAVALFGGTAGGFFAAGMAISLLATINAMCVVGPRVYYAMAQDGAFFAVAGRVHPRWRTPWVAIMAQGACCCVLIITGAFESLGYYIGFTLWLFSALSVVALLRFRRRPGWRTLPATSFLFPALPLIYTTANVLIFLYFLSQRRLEALAGLATVLGGMAAYAWLRRSRS
ncbi:MAG: amino acid permease [bacterium]|nr:amino acid permease [bacterium]